MEKRKIEIILDLETGECEIYLENWSENKYAIATLKNVIAKLEESGGEKMTVIISDSPEMGLEDLRKPVEQWPAEFQPKPAEEMFYIQNGYVGNAVCWWAKNSRGYVSDLESAEKYTREQASAIVERSRGKGFVGWPCKYIDENEAARKLIIDCQYLSRQDCQVIEEKNKSRK